MRSKYLSYLILLIVAGSLSSCKKDGNLTVHNLGAVSSVTTWSSTSTADLFLNDIYNSLPDDNGFDFDPYENWSDNSMNGGGNWVISATLINNMPNLNASSDLVQWYGSWMLPTNWGGLYGGIRKCNVFISNVAASASLPASYKAGRLGEAHMLRAYFYHLLWMNYGGVPIITVPDNINTQGDSIFHPRASFDDTYNFIVNDLDSSITLLPANSGNSGNGRVTQGAAMTLKGWVQLYYASPLNNPSNDVSRWASAAATNKAVMGMGYALYPSYPGLFLTTGNSNNEGILYREYFPVTKGSSNISAQGPSYIANGLWFSWGTVNPTQELVDDYAMENGKSIHDIGSGYDPANPYNKREPRFYQSVLSNGSTFNGYSFTSYLGTDAGGNIADNPLDISDNFGTTNTGYALRKRMDTTVNMFQGSASSQNWYYFRYAEVLLNYAEAQNEAVGPDASVYAALDLIRSRAGVPAISMVYPGITQDSMRQVIRRERRIELAFEDKRWPDLLRWKLAEVNLNSTSHAMSIAYSGGVWTYTVVPAARGGRAFDKTKNYLLPIPQSALDQNPKLKQNPGY